MSNKVLLVTDYSGSLHITPVGNKDFYKAQNNRNKTQQYGLKEMDEKEAYKFVEDNNGIDPDFKTPKQTAAVIADKDAEIRALREQLAALNDPNSEQFKQRQQMAELSTASVGNGDYSKAGPNDHLNQGQHIASGAGAGHTHGDTVKAADLISKIGEAKTSDEVNALVPDSEKRATVIAARDQKLQEFKK